MELYIILIISAALLAILIIATYNSFVSLKNQSKNAFAQIDVQLKRRNDLIPNLVEAVKGYMKHEKSLFNEIAKARTQVMSAKSVENKAKASFELSNALKSFFAVAENYPKLKASENFLQLQEEISSTENRIAYSRQYYNDIITSYNIRIETFPQNLIAKAFGFKKMEQFSADESERANVNIKI